MSTGHNTSAVNSQQQILNLTQIIQKCSHSKNIKMHVVKIRNDRNAKLQMLRSDSSKDLELPIKLSSEPV
jgi:hypothetical protein